VGFFKRKVPKIGLALGSGAARGLAHIGVLKALNEAVVPIDMIAGASMGSVIGACFAMKRNVTAVEELTLSTDWRQLNRFLDLNLTSLRKGLIRGEKIEEILYSLIGDVRFEDLDMPFAVIATDVNTGEEVVLKEGSVIEAVKASISIPAIFVPVKIKDRFLVDGGVINPVPADILQDMGAKFIVAVNVLIEPQERKHATSSQANEASEVPSIFSALLQSLYIMEHEIIKARTLKADIIITPDVNRIGAFDFYRGADAILEGYRATQRILPRLQNLIGKP